MSGLATLARLSMADVGLRVPCTPRLNRRSLTNLLRNKMLFAARIGQTVFLGSSSFPIRSSAPSAFPVGCFEHDRFAHACQNVLCWSVRR